MLARYGDSHSLLAKTIFQLLSGDHIRTIFECFSIECYDLATVHAVLLTQRRSGLEPVSGSLSHTMSRAWYWSGGAIVALTL